jgi:hypothetical protein
MHCCNKEAKSNAGRVFIDSLVWGKVAFGWNTKRHFCSIDQLQVT